MTELRVFLADDHAVVRAGLKALVEAEQDMVVVGEAADGLDACAQVAELNPDVVVMDLSMPLLTGAQATERIRRECPETRVLALTVHEDKAYIRQLLGAGASGYVLKRAAAEALIQAIRTVAAGKIYLDPEMVGKVVTGFARRSDEASPRVSAALSDREEAVARLTAAGNSNKEIAAQLELSVKTVETYRARAMEKLGLNSRTELVRHASRLGWLSEG